MTAPDPLAWAAAALPAPVVRVVVLAGGLDADTRLLETADGDRAVLRALVTEAARRDQPLDVDLALLRAVEGLGVPAAQVLAADLTGAEAGVPALLTTWLPGRPGVQAADPAALAAEVVERLAPLHALPVTGALAALPDRVAWVRDVLSRSPSWLAEVPRGEEVWERLRALAPPLDAPRAPVHHDAWFGNLLVDEAGALTGVVDWGDAGLGLPEADHALARLDAVLLGADPDGLPGRGAHLPFYDLWAALLFAGHLDRGWWEGYAALGAPVSRDEVRQRAHERVRQLLG